MTRLDRLPARPAKQKSRKGRDVTRLDGSPPLRRPGTVRPRLCGTEPLAKVLRKRPDSRATHVAHMLVAHSDRIKCTRVCAMYSVCVFATSFESAWARMRAHVHEHTRMPVATYAQKHEQERTMRAAHSPSHKQRASDTHHAPPGSLALSATDGWAGPHTRVAEGGPATHVHAQCERTHAHNTRATRTRHTFYRGPRACDSALTSAAPAARVMTCKRVCAHMHSEKASYTQKQERVRPHARAWAHERAPITSHHITSHRAYMTAAPEATAKSCRRVHVHVHARVRRTTCAQQRERNRTCPSGGVWAREQSPGASHCITSHGARMVARHERLSVRRPARAPDAPVDDHRRERGWTRGAGGGREPRTRTAASERERRHRHDGACDGRRGRGGRRWRQTARRADTRPWCIWASPPWRERMRHARGPRAPRHASRTVETGEPSPAIRGLAV